MNKKALKDITLKVSSVYSAIVISIDNRFWSDKKNRDKVIDNAIEQMRTHLKKELPKQILRDMKRVTFILMPLKKFLK